MAEHEENYSEESFGSEEPSARHSSKSSVSALHRSRRSSDTARDARNQNRSRSDEDEEEERYSDTFEPEHATTFDATVESGPTGPILDVSQLPLQRPQPLEESQLSSRSRYSSARKDSQEDSQAESNRSLFASREEAQSRKSAASSDAGSSAGSGGPTVRALDISQLPVIASAPQAQADRPPPYEAQRPSEASASSVPGEKQRLGSCDGEGREVDISAVADDSAGRGAVEPPELAAREPAKPVDEIADFHKVLRPTGSTQLPSAPAQWRTPDTLAEFGGEPAQSRGVSSCSHDAEQGQSRAVGSYSHDAVPRHLKPHAWDLASLGQEPPGASEGQHSHGRATPGCSDQRTNGGLGRSSGQRSHLTAGAEEKIVAQLAQRFMFDRRDPTLQRMERAAYKDMLQQVAWTALEPSAAQELASLLGSGRAPVSSTEALRAFRRCLHAILTDERVLDIVEKQMSLHFKRVATTNM